MRPAGEHGDDQAFRVRSDFPGPAAEPIRRPLGVAPVGTGHMVGVRAVLAAHGAALIGADASAAMEDLNRACGDSHVDLGADQRVGDRIEKVMDLDVIVEIDPRTPPFRELPIVGGQGDEGVALDLSNSSRRLRPRLRMGRSFMRRMTRAMAALHSASEKKVSPRSRPRM